MNFFVVRHLIKILTYMHAQATQVENGDAVSFAFCVEGICLTYGIWKFLNIQILDPNFWHNSFGSQKSQENLEQKIWIKKINGKNNWKETRIGNLKMG